MAIEVHIPRDIDEYQPAFMLGFKKKHFIYVAASAALVVPNVIWGNLIMPNQLSTLLNIIIGIAAITPMVIDSKTRGIIPAEEFIANFFHFMFSPRTRRYEYLDYIAMHDDKLENKRYEELKAEYSEATKKSKQASKKRPKLK